MFDNFKSTISTLFHLFNHRMAPPDDILPIRTQHVTVYLKSLQAVNTCKGTKALGRWKLIETRGYKAKSISRHEYMVSALCGPGNKVYYLAIERMGGELAVPNTRPMSRSEIDLSRPTLLNSISSSKSSLVSISDSSSPDRLAEDRISVLQSWKKDKDDILVGTLIFPDEDKSPSLYELAILAVIVHKASPSYLLLSKNCYHYAGTIMRVLREAYSPAVMKMDGVHAGMWWCGLDLFTAHKGNTPALCDALRKEVKEFVSFFLCRVI